MNINNTNNNNNNKSSTMITTNVRTNNSSSFSLREVEHNKTSLLPSSSSSPLQISTICSVSDTKSIILEQDNSHIVKIQLTENINNKINHSSNNSSSSSTNFSKIFNNKLKNNSSKVSYVSIGLPSATSAPSLDLAAGSQLSTTPPVVATTVTKTTTSPIVSSLLVNKTKSTLTSFIKLDSNKENILKNFNNSVININSSNHSCENNHSEFIKSNEMVVQKSNQNSSSDLDVNAPYYYYMMPSGQCSPSDTLDSGTCSDLEVSPPPLPKKMSAQSKYLHVSSTATTTTTTVADGGINVAANDTNQSVVVSNLMNSNLSDSDESQLSLSCDSLNGSDIIMANNKNNNNNSDNNNNNSNIDFGISISPQSSSPEPTPTPPALPPPSFLDLEALRASIVCLPDSLLKDIRDRSNKLNLNETSKFELKDKIEIRSYLTREQQNNTKNVGMPIVAAAAVVQKAPVTIFETINQNFYENDKFYKFHINENVHDPPMPTIKPEIDESFAGYKDINNGGTSTIRSAKGTVRGVKNRVRNGIATFLQMQHTNIKNYKEKDAGKVVLYTTSMGILRDTYARCVNMKQILRTLLIKFEERDVFMSCEYQLEIKDRMQSDKIIIPQLFVDGQHIGDADYVERLNETGELRRMLKPYKCLDPSYTCQLCGGYRLLPCPSCNGSKKSVHRNHFTAEFIALKCMNCDEVGLVKCYNC